MNEMLVLMMIAAVILALAIVIWITSRRRRESALDTLRARSKAAHEPVPASDTFAQVRMLMARGEKIEAIKLVRERMKLDLKDAKELFDRFE